MLGLWIAWLAESPPDENYHLHVLWHLESEASRFEGVRPKNVWFLKEPEEAQQRDLGKFPQEAIPVEFEVTLMVLTETQLDELAEAQESDLIPNRLLKTEPTWQVACE
jgi:hypothetical protein